MKTFIDDVIEFCTKNIALIMTLSVGAVIKALVDLKIRDLRWYERVVNVVLSVCIGWVAWKYLKVNDKEDWSGFIVPLATLFGETIVMWTMTKSTVILDRILDKYFPKK